MTELDLRRIGGSDIAALMSRDPWGRGPLDVYLRIVEGIGVEQTPAMCKGKRFERSIGEWWREISESGSEYGWWGLGSIHPEDRPWQRATPDMVAHREGQVYGVADIKRYRDARLSCGEPGTDQIGDYELLQLTTYAECLRHTGNPTSELRLVVHDLHTDELAEYQAEYSPDLGAAIVETAERFWLDHVEPKIPPPLTGSRLVRTWLERRFPAAILGTRDSTPVEDAEALRLRELREEIRERERECDEIENRLRESIGEHSKVTGEWGSITWREVAGGEVSYYRKPCRGLRTIFRRSKNG